MKLADYIIENLVGDEGRDDVMQCADLNRKTFELAMTLASPAAMDRMMTR